MESDTLPPLQMEPQETAAPRWERWLRRLDNFLLARDITADGRKRALMLHYVGEEVFDLSGSIGVTNEDTFEEARRKLSDFFYPETQCGV